MKIFRCDRCNKEDDYSYKIKKYKFEGGYFGFLKNEAELCWSCNKKFIKLLRKFMKLK